MASNRSIWDVVRSKLIQDTIATEDHVVSKIQNSMLLLVDTHCDVLNSALEQKILSARDVDGLWYLRPELMHAISRCKDQSTAWEAIDEISHLFSGYHKIANLSKINQRQRAD
jgi:hypothetical protein